MNKLGTAAGLGVLGACIAGTVCCRRTIRIPLEEYTRYALYMAVMDDEICRNELEGNWIDGKEITFPPKMESLQQRYHTAIWRPVTRRALLRPSWSMQTALSAACPTDTTPCLPVMELT